MGVNIALDDFGTGYASLRHLKQLPLNTVKIDRSFVQNLLDAPQDEAIVKAAIALAEGLGLRLVAEGVETHELAHYLQKMGCRYLQGYWLSRPQPAEVITPLLQRTNSSRQPSNQGVA
ncbi:MAG: EAL domain-containing protein [Synechococcales cyanobacterium CRU_2_2]|nr:EAL domain-containing protein [Synechococcales cyanobacterium CRU_2_2]